jgi:hypothetical protein
LYDAEDLSTVKITDFRVSAEHRHSVKGYWYLPRLPSCLPDDSLGLMTTWSHRTFWNTGRILEHYGSVGQTVILPPTEIMLPVEVVLRDPHNNAHKRSELN